MSILALLCGKSRNPERNRGLEAVSVSLFDTMTDMMGYPLTYTQHSGIDQQPLGMSSPAVAPYGAIARPTSRRSSWGTTNDREWQRLAREILHRDDLADDERFRTNSDRCRNRAVLDEAIGTWCAQHDLAHVQKTADEAGIGNSRYNVPSEVLEHPQLSERDRWRTIDTPAGPVRAILPPPIVAGREPRMDPVPRSRRAHRPRPVRFRILTVGDRGSAPAGRGGPGVPAMTASELRIDGPVLLHDDLDGVRTLTLNRPPAGRTRSTRNSGGCLRDALDDAGTDRTCVRWWSPVPPVRSARARTSRTPGVAHPMRKMRVLTDVALLLHELPVPTVAKVNGVAVGAGWNLALGCDLVVATPESTFSQIFTKRGGLSLDLGGSWLLPKLIGLQQAKRLALLAETIDAEQALAMNLVTWVVPGDEIDGSSTTSRAGWWRVHRLRSPRPRRCSTRVPTGLCATLSRARRGHRQRISRRWTPPEAFSAFAEKREPRFTGRWAVGRDKQ